MNDEKELIIKYALQSPENLRVALLTCESYDDLKKTVVSTFAKKLEDRLRKKLREDWIVKNELIYDKCLEAWHGIYISKNAWQSLDISIRLETEANARRFFAGIRCPQANRPKSLNEQQLREELTEKKDKGKKNNFWIYYYDVADKYKNWTIADTMWLLHDKSSQEEALDYFVKEFLDLKNLVADEIDKGIKK